MYGLDWDDPLRLRSSDELINWVNEVGFLPLFRNTAPGFSVEEHTADQAWWTGDPATDPWVWREIIARSGKVTYGKFFNRKAGFISLEWFPVFANYRRDGYDFDARWDDELASMRCKKIMDRFEERGEWAGYELKSAAGFGKDGEKNFSGLMEELQMESYLVIKDFRKKRSKKGNEYGMPISIFSKPEDVWGYEMVTKAYREEPAESKGRIIQKVMDSFPELTEQQVTKLV